MNDALVCTCPDFDPGDFDGPEDHAAACAGCPTHGTGVEVTPVTDCQCEHVSHARGNDGHAYLGVPANPDGVAMHVGPVCDDCADGHLADYMRHCDRCGSPGHWTEDHPAPEPTIPELIAQAKIALAEHQAGSHDGMTRCLEAILSVLDDLADEVTEP